MARTASLIALGLALTLPFAAAAQRLGGGPAADPAAAFEVYGTVTSFSADFGAGMPALVVDDPALGAVVVGLGPVWYLQQEGFAAAPGDAVELLAYPCATCSLPAVAAWVNNLTTGAAIVLRDDEGHPQWTSRGGGRGGHPRCDLAGAKDGNGPGEGNGPNGPGDGNGPNGSCEGDGSCDGEGPHGPGEGEGPHGPGEGEGPHGPGEGSGPHGGQCAWAAPDMSAVAAVEGTVVSVSAAPAQGMPSMVLATAEGELTLVLSPYHPIAAAGFLIEPGMALEVTYAPWAVGGEAVLATIAIADPVTGLVIQLRDPETGFPISTGGGHNRPNWP